MEFCNEFSSDREAKGGPLMRERIKKKIAMLVVIVLALFFCKRHQTIPLLYGKSWGFNSSSEIENPL